jgi:transposase
MSRYDLTSFEWRVIEPLLPNKPRGVPRVDDRRVLNGIFWVLRSGAPWRDLPELRRVLGVAIVSLVRRNCHQAETAQTGETDEDAGRGYHHSGNGWVYSSPRN